MKELSEREHVYTGYDPDLGWVQVPNGRSDDGLNFANSAGYRAASTDAPGADPEAARGVLRIALFGDSFTHGSQVRFEDSWGYVLERQLNEAGLRAEVLNFGAGGYGMDQAFLRWRKQGRAYRPDVVLFGFLDRDVRRNLNLVRRIGHPTSGNPYSKPRFVLDDGGSLRLINTPTVPLDELPALLRGFEEWEFHNYESGYRPEDYKDPWWIQSRLLGFLEARLRKRSSSSRSPRPANSQKLSQWLFM